MQLTILLGKIFGLTYLVTCIACLARPRAVLDAANSWAENPGLLLISGVFTFAAGVASVIGHNVWTGGALPVAVTLLGWLMLAKGAAMMFLPPPILIAAYGSLNSPRKFRLAMIPATVFAAWVTFLAFTA